MLSREAFRSERRGDGPAALDRTGGSDFLAACPPPVHTSDVEAWRRRVEAELGAGALPGLVELLEVGSPAEQDAAMATARTLGAEVWAVGVEPELLVRSQVVVESAQSC
jgi:hypothetical protein